MDRWLDVQWPHVSDETAKCVMDFCMKIDKVPIHIKKEVDGFMLNRIIAAINHEATWLLEMGGASCEDIDKGCVYGAGHSMGPSGDGSDEYRSGDDIDMRHFYESSNPADLSSLSIVKKYTGGKYGQKAGKAWYSYKE